MPADGQVTAVQQPSDPGADAPGAPAQDDQASIHLPKPAPGDAWRPWNPPPDALFFVLSRVTSDGRGKERCSVWDPSTKEKRERHPCSPHVFEREWILGTWGSGAYSCVFFGPTAETEAGKKKIAIASGPIRFELEDPRFPRLPAEARVIDEIDESAMDDDDDDDDDDEERHEEDEEASSLRADEARGHGAAGDPPTRVAPFPRSETPGVLRRLERLEAENRQLRDRLRSPYGRSAAPAVPRERERERERERPKEKIERPAPMLPPGFDPATFHFMQWMQDQVDARARSVIEQDRERARRQLEEENERHKRNLDEMNERHLRSLEIAREDRKASPETRALAKKIDELASRIDEDDEPEEERPSKVAEYTALAKELAPVLGPILAPYLAKKGAAE